MGGERLHRTMVEHLFRCYGLLKFGRTHDLAAGQARAGAAATRTATATMHARQVGRR
jgi:hypothetical protein